MEQETKTLKKMVSVKNGYNITVEVKQTSTMIMDKKGLSRCYFVFKAKKANSPFHRFTEKVNLGFTHDLKEIEAIINAYIAAF